MGGVATVSSLSQRLKVNAFAEWIAYRPRRSFSQCGEDAVLQGLIVGMPRPGFYVDIGAFSPKAFSNTYVLYKQGWRGINVDPAPGSMRAFNVMRRRDVNLEIAISDEPGTLALHVFGRRSALNTVSLERAEYWEKETGRSARVVEVPTRTLASVLDEHADVPLQLLSVDVEGHDMAVLRSNNWDRYRPALIVVEDHSVEQMIAQGTPPSDALGDSRITRFLAQHGYHLCAWTPPSLIFRP